MTNQRENDPVLPADLGPVGLKTRIDQEARERRALMLLEKSRKAPENLPQYSIDLVELGNNEEMLMGIAQEPATDVEISRITQKGIESEHFNTPEQYVAHLSGSRRWALAGVGAGAATLLADGSLWIYRVTNHLHEVIQNPPPKGILLTVPIIGNINNPFSLEYISGGLSPEQTIGMGVIAGLAATGAFISADRFDKINRTLGRFNRIRALRQLKQHNQVKLD